MWKFPTSAEHDQCAPDSRTREILERIAEAKEWTTQARSATQLAYGAHPRLLKDICSLTEEQADRVEPAFTELEKLLFGTPDL